MEHHIHNILYMYTVCRNICSQLSTRKSPSVAVHESTSRKNARGSAVGELRVTDQSYYTTTIYTTHNISVSGLPPARTKQHMDIDEPPPPSSSSSSYMIHFQRARACRDSLRLCARARD